MVKKAAGRKVQPATRRGSKVRLLAAVLTLTLASAGAALALWGSKPGATPVRLTPPVALYTAYDALGRVRGSAQTTDGVTYSMPDYRYNLAGNLVSEQYPSGRVLKTEYDAAGRVAGVRNQATGLYYAGGDPTVANNAQVIGYTAGGATSQMRLGNGLWEHTAYNSRSQPVQIGLGTSASDLSKLRLSYDYGAAGRNNGNLMGQRMEAGGLDFTQTYDYDAVNRLLRAQEAPTAGGGDVWRQTYTYSDATGQNAQFGNRRIDTSSDPATGQPRTTANATPQYNPTINAATNRFDVNQGYSYDAAGNLTQDPTHSYGYDAENRMAAADGGWNGATGASYYYDGDGRRVKKVSGAEATVFIYDAAGRLAAEYSNRVESNGTSYLTQDTLGSTRVVTDKDGTAKARHDYFPFGEEASAGIGGRTTNQGYSVAESVRQKFTGYERDTETGLDYAQARYYASMQGRFIGVNPLMASAQPTRPQSWNRYAYCLNNPLAYVDPTGLIWGEHDLGKGRSELKWFKDQKELDAAGASWKATTNFLRPDPNGGWYAFNRYAESYDHLSDYAVAGGLFNGGTAYRVAGLTSPFFQLGETAANAADDALRSEAMQTVLRDPGVQGALLAMGVFAFPTGMAGKPSSIMVTPNMRRSHSSAPCCKCIRRVVCRPAPSIVVRSHRRRGAIGFAVAPREGRGRQCRGTDGIRAAGVGRSASPNLRIPPARPRFEAGR
jgi:RHS repeat-associated protein